MEGAALGTTINAVVQTIADLAWPVESTQQQGPLPEQQRSQQQQR